MISMLEILNRKIIDLEEALRNSDDGTDYQEALFEKLIRAHDAYAIFKRVLTQEE